MSLAIAIGSLQDQLRTREATTLAEAFTHVKLIILCDRSGSMMERDAYGGHARYTIEDELVERLQAQNPGKILLASFSSGARLHPDGKLPQPSGGTEMLGGLQLVQPLCVNDVKLALISDGEPTDSPEHEIIAYARQNLAGRLSTYFAGPENSDGAKFMRRLAEACQGASGSDALTKPLQLEKELRLLLKSA